MKVENAVRCLAGDVDLIPSRWLTVPAMHHPVPGLSLPESVGSRYMQFIPLVERCGENGTGAATG